MNCYEFLNLIKNVILEILEYDLYKGVKWVEDYD